MAPIKDIKKITKKNIRWMKICKMYGTNKRYKENNQKKKYKMDGTNKIYIENNQKVGWHQ